MSNAEEKYKDIIHMERPWDTEVLRKHPRMDLSARAKIFSPFAAVRGHDERLRKEDEKLNLVEHRELSEDDAARLSEHLSSLKKGMKITVVYFLPENSNKHLGNYTEVTGTVMEADMALDILRITIMPKDRLAKGKTITIPFYHIATIDLIDQNPENLR